MNSFSKLTTVLSGSLAELRRLWGGDSASVLAVPQPFPLASRSSGTFFKERIKATRLVATTYPRTLVGLLLAALSFAVYLPVLPGILLMDDLKLIEWDNPIVSGKLSAFSIWFQSDFPLSTLVFWLERLAWGKNPAWYHFINIALHSASAFLIWCLLKRLRVRGALLAALLFAVHPVCVTSVARIAELKNTLSLPFFLISFWAYISYEDISLYPGAADSVDRRSSRGTLAYSASLTFFILALFSKTSTIMLPPALLAAALWRRGRLGFKDVLHCAPHFSMALAFGLMSAWFQKYQALAGQTLPSQSFAERLVLASRALWFYLGKALLPWNLNLVYPRWNIDAHAVSAYAPILLICAFFLVCFFVQTRLTRATGVALACFGILLFPALGFFDAQYLTMWQVSDHLQYLPLIAPVVLAAALVASVRNPRIVASLGMVLVCAFAAMTHHRAWVFSTEESLLRDTLAKNPAAWAAHNDLGCLLARKEDYGQALSHFTASLASHPENAEAHVNLGQLLSMQGKVNEAEAHFVSALKLKPGHPDAHLRYAAMLARRGRERQALLHYRSALAANPAFQTRMEFSALLFQTGDNREAVRQLEQVLAAQPDWPEALNNLAWILSTCSDAEVRNGRKAISFARRACELTGFQKAGMLGTLAAANAEAGEFPEAIATAEKAIAAAVAGGDLQFAELNRQLLKLYRSEKAWHEKPGKTAS
jgi:tetratricopeptide (TPR) repeat protein